MAFNLGTAVGYLDLDTSKFTRGFKSAQQDLKLFQDEAATASQKLGAVGSSMSSAGASLTKGLTLPIVGAGAALVKVTANFESSMSKVMAITDTTGQDATEVYDKLSKKAQEMGASTRYSASEAADALYYMSLAGWNADQSISGLDGVLSLAAASGMDLAQASDMVTDYLTAFGLEASYASNMADVLAYAQANSNTTTQLLGDAFGNCATQAKAFGADLESTTAYLATLANSGLKGSEAGTALSAVFRDITQKMENGKIAIGKTSVAVQDAEGNFRDLTDILADVAKATDGLGTAEKSAALMETFTSRSIKAVNIMLDEGADSINEFTDKLFESQGTAAQQSEAMLDNLQGQITILKSALEGVAIAFGQYIIPYVTQAAKWVTNFLTKINSMSERSKKLILTIAGIAAAIGPVLIVIGKIATGIAGISKAITIVKSAFTALSAVLAANPIILIIAAIAALVAAFIYLWNNCEEFRQFWINLWEGIKDVAVTVWTAIKDFLVSSWEWIKTTAVSVWTSVHEFFSGLWDGVSSFFITTWNKISTFFTTTWNNMLTFFTTVSSSIGNAILNFVNDIVTWFSELPGKILTIGRNIVEGLWAGISAAGAWLGEQISGFAATVLGWFKAAFGIASPSKKMREQGKDLIRGLDEGMEDEERDLYSTVDDIANGVIDQMQGSLTDLKVGFGGVEDQDYLQEFNGYLYTTLDIYTQIRTQLELCQILVEQMSLSGASMVQQMLPATSEVIPDTALLESRIASVQPVDASGEVIKTGAESKPDTMTVNLYLGEDQIESVLVDLIQREVRQA